MASAGRMKEKGDWLFSYYYARIEALAVQTSYAQDGRRFRLDFGYEF